MCIKVQEILNIIGEFAGGRICENETTKLKFILKPNGKLGRYIRIIRVNRWGGKTIQKFHGALQGWSPILKARSKGFNKIMELKLLYTNRRNFNSFSNFIGDLHNNDNPFETKPYMDKINDVISKMQQDYVSQPLNYVPHSTKHILYFRKYNSVNSVDIKKFQ